MSQIGRRIIQLSLKTSSLVEAKKRRALADVEWNVSFEVAEQVSSKAGVSELGRSNIERLVGEYVQSTSQKLASSFVETPPSQDQRSEMRGETKQRLSWLSQFETGYGAEMIARSSEQIFKGTEAGPCQAVATEYLRRGLVEFERRKLALLRDEFAARHFDPLFAPERKSAVTFGELSQQYLEKRQAEDDANRTRQKRVTNGRFAYRSSPNWSALKHRWQTSIWTAA